jgi:hypothetical protein
MDTARLKSMTTLSRHLPPFPPHSVFACATFSVPAWLVFSVLYTVAGRLLQLILCPSRHHPPVGCHHLQFTTQDALYQIVASLHISSFRISFLLHGLHPPFYLFFSSHSAFNFHRIRHSTL